MTRNSEPETACVSSLVPPVTCRAALVSALLVMFVLAACGDGGGNAPQSEAPLFDPPSTPNLQRSPAVIPFGMVTSADLSSNEPITTSGQFVFIGTPDISQAISGFDRNYSHRHGNARVGHLRLNDGVTQAQLLSYLEASAATDSGLPTEYVRRWRSNPPIVRMMSGSSNSDRQDTMTAVRIINSMLPPDWQLTFDSTDTDNTEVVFNYIGVRFTAAGSPGAGCSFIGKSDVLGCSLTSIQDGRAYGGTVWVHPSRNPHVRDRLYVLFHEILHVLGRIHMSQSGFETVMHESRNSATEGWLLLTPVDEAALYAVYEHLSPGTAKNSLDMTDIDSWSDQSTYVFGLMDHSEDQNMLFGAVWQNGLVRPYVAAHNPSPPLPNQSTSARWLGRLIGLTPEAETVAGSMAMTINFGSMRGEVDFTAMEKWAAQAGPGATGSGTRWGDGDLHYDLRVDERQVFVEIGGDSGEITGQFFGDGHEGAAGTLKRTDLSAGFAGAQQ